MRLNIEWIAPWRHSGWRGPWLFHTFSHHDANTDVLTGAGICAAGFYARWTRTATTHGVGFAVLL